MEWEGLLGRQILFVSGKGGAGKSTVAASLASLAASVGLRTLLVEVEGRGEIARTLGVPDPGFEERPTPFGFAALSITPREAVIEYLHIFTAMDRVGRPLLRSGAIDQVIGAAPGFRDLLACGKLFEIARVRRSDRRDRGRPEYDLLVVDAPPTGQIAGFLSAPAAFADLTRVGRVKRQAAAVDRLLRSHAQVVLVGLLEEMSVTETLEAIPAIKRAGVRVAALVANRRLPEVFPVGTRRAAGRLDAPRVAALAAEVGVEIRPDTAAALLRGAIDADGRRRLQERFRAELSGVGAVLDLPELPGRDPPATVAAVVGAMRGDRTAPTAPTRGGRWRPSVAGATLDQALARARVVVVCGSGGVGKTTISAAVAIHLAGRGTRTALLTVDPARRLATALRLPTALGERAVVRIGRGRSLEAMQLDTQRTFDELIRRHAGSAESRDRILGNRFYRRISDTLAGTNEYMAMEKLYELATEEDHEALVVDTPPTRSALSFIEAPTRMTEFLGSRFLKLMLWPTLRAGRLTVSFARMGASAFARTVGRLIGAEVIADTADFLAAFEGMYGGFRERATRVMELLRSPACAFVVVTAPTVASLAEAGFFIERLSGSGMRPTAVVASRWHQEGAAIPAGAEHAVEALASGGAEERTVAAVLADRIRREPRAVADQEAMARFAAGHPSIPIVGVPELSGDVHDVPGLRRVAGHLFATAAAERRVRP